MIRFLALLVLLVGTYSVSAQVNNPTAGGAGNPAGSSGQVQVNSSGSFGGLTQNQLRVTAGIDQITDVANASFPYQILATDFCVATKADYAAAQTVVLPASAGLNSGDTVCIFDQAQKVTAVNTLTFGPNGSDTLTGVTSMNAAGGLVTCKIDKNPATPNWSCYGSVPTGASGTMAFGQGSTIPFNWVTPSGDWTINNLGVAAVGKVQGMPFPSSCPFAGEILDTTTANTFGCTKTPTLGSSGVLGSLAMGNNTSGTGTFSWPVGVALGSSTFVPPVGTNDFSATGGASQVVKQTSVGGAFTVARLVCADLSDSSSGCSGASSSAAGLIGNTTPVLVNANATTAQLLQELHPANGAFNTINQIIKLHQSGIFTVTAGTPTVTVTAKLCNASNSGCVTLAAVTSAAVITATNDQFVFETSCGVSATGASGTLTCHGTQFTDLTSGSTSSSTSTDNNTAASSTFDLTGATFIDFTFTFSTNQVSPNTATGQLAYAGAVGIATPVSKANGGTASTTGAGAATALSHEYVVCNQNTQQPGTPFTGSLAETVLATCTVPANTIGANGQLRITAAVQRNAAGTSSVTFKVRWGTAGTTSDAQIQSVGISTGAVAGVLYPTFIANRAATNSQVYYNGATCCTIGGVFPTLAVDTTGQTIVTITGTLGNTGDNEAAEMFLVEYLPAGGN